MTIPKNVLEWRKQHNEKRAAQGLPPIEPNNLTLEELKEQWMRCQSNLTNLLEKIRASTPSGGQE